MSFSKRRHSPDSDNESRSSQAYFQSQQVFDRITRINVTSTDVVSSNIPPPNIASADNEPIDTSDLTLVAIPSNVADTMVELIGKFR